jgi:TRAP transporter TAXI family solute receptor
MKKLSAYFLLITFSWLLILSELSYSTAYRFSGGPSGGTFQYYASAISTIAKKNNLKVLASSSGGAIENIRTTNSGKSSFAVTYSGHVYAAINGNLKNDEKKYNNVLAVSYLYGAPAQLVVRKDSDIDSPTQLSDKKVGVGNAGSGAAANAEIYFTQIGIWDKMDREFLGYRSAANAFKNGQLDAFWVFVGYPNASVMEAALQNDIKLLDTYFAGEAEGLFKDYPFFDKVTIPAKTYRGQSKAVNTFQDAALWVANKDVPADVVYNLMKAVYSEDGLKYMVEVHQSAKAMTVENGVKGIVTPLHPGAIKFWKEKGVLK